VIADAPQPVLELASGTGILTAQLRARLAPSNRVIGLVKGNPVCLTIQERGGALERSPLPSSASAAIIRSDRRCRRLS
jgi:hypothetical protein